MSPHPTDVTSTVEAEHEHIKETMTLLADELARDVEPADFPQWKLTYLWRLRDFQAMLLKHFDLEEEGGFTTDLLRLAPHRANQIRQVEAEHRKIMALLTQLTGLLKRMDRLTDVRMARLRDQLQDLVALIRTHEAAECELIQAAYYEDFGVGD